MAVREIDQKKLEERLRERNVYCVYADLCDQLNRVFSSKNHGKDNIRATLSGYVQLHQNGTSLLPDSFQELQSESPDVYERIIKKIYTALTDYDVKI